VPDSFEARFPGLFDTAYRTAFRFLGSRTAAEDVAIEAVARCETRWRTVEEYAEAWVSRVAINLAIDELRRDRRRRGLSFRTSEAPSQEAAVVARDQLQRAVARLPARQREAVVLRLVADLPESEVARLMRTSIGTTKQHFARGVAALRRHLVEQEEP